MKKTVLIISLFTLFSMASFEVARQSYNHFSPTVNVSLNPLLKGFNNISNVSIDVKTNSKINAENAKESNKLEKEIIAYNNIRIKKFNYKPSLKKTKRFTRKEENLEKFIINNKELVSLTAMDSPMIKTLAVTSLLNGFSLPIENPVFDHDKNVIAKTENSSPKKTIPSEPKKEDAIKVSMSATEKLSAQEEEMINSLVNNVQIDKVDKKKDKKKSDDLLFFDYSDKELVDQAVEGMKNDLPKVVSMLQQTTKEIKNEINAEKIQTPKKLPKGTLVDLPKHSEVTTQPKPVAPDYSKNKASQDIKNIMSSQKKNDYPRNAKLTIKTSVGLIGKSLTANDSQFQFISDVSFGEPMTSGSIGAIEISEMINERVSTIRGTLLGSNTFPTIVELPLEYGDYLMNIPLLERDDVFRKFEGMRGALLLVELDESTDSIDIDHKYIERVYLNERFKEVDEGDDYRFILFVGVEPGNTLIQYLTLNEEVGEKIVHLVEDHVFYESNTFIESKKENIELYETKVLGKRDLELNIDEEDMVYFNSSIKSKSVGINLYEMDVPVMPLGMRKYLELNHLGETIYAGYQDNHSVHIPSKEYLNYVMDTFDINTIENQCMIQVNFNKPIVEFTYASESYKGPIPFEVLYLDKDGMFNEDASDFAKKVFLVGDTPGSVNFKVEYADNSVDYFQSFCSTDTFVVEQL